MFRVGLHIMMVEVPLLCALINVVKALMALVNGYHQKKRQKLTAVSLILNNFF